MTPSAFPTRLTRLIILFAHLALLSACGRTDPGPPAIRLTETAIEVSGLPAATLTALERARYTDEQWTSIFRVSTQKDGPPMLGSYAIADDIVRFTPAFPLDPGRQYEVSFDASRVASATASTLPLTATVGRPAGNSTPTTLVTRVYPSGEVIPANILRMYIEFSAPMGRKSGVEYITLLDASGKDVPGAVLPLDYEFWSPDHRRFTVFFDPGRVKQGILPNREMGRAFKAGETATLVISREWRDENGLPLKEEFRRNFRAVAADERPLDPAQWSVAAPTGGGRDALVVTFPKPLDHSLLMRGVGVRRGKETVAGQADVTDGETRWRFTPREPWRPGVYDIVVLDIVEDVAGNQVGRAFEVDNFDSVDDGPDPKTVALPFTVR